MSSFRIHSFSQEHPRKCLWMIYIPVCDHHHHACWLKERFCCSQKQCVFWEDPLTRKCIQGFPNCHSRTVYPTCDRLNSIWLLDMNHVHSRSGNLSFACCCQHMQPWTCLPANCQCSGDQVHQDPLLSALLSYWSTAINLLEGNWAKLSIFFLLLQPLVVNSTSPSSCIRLMNREGFYKMVLGLLWFFLVAFAINKLFKLLSTSSLLLLRSSIL